MSTRVGAVALAALAAACTPDVATTTTAAGGAGSGATTSGATTKAASTVGSTTAASTTSSNTGPATGSSTASSSTSTGGCVVGSQTCTGLDTTSLPSCPMTTACAAADCAAYCSAISSECPEQYPDGAACCKICEILKLNPPKTCCHVAGLNDQIKQDLQDACTRAGPFGSATQTADGCGTQGNNACEIYGSLCSSLCSKSKCLATLNGEPSMNYENGVGGGTLAEVMDLLLGSSQTKCEQVAAIVCS